MSSEIALKVENLSKCYHIYETPRDRLKQIILPPLVKLSGKIPRQYYREFWALKDIEFEISKGESVGIIGRNGSGKSTLLQIITGTLEPTSGSFTTFGRIGALLELGSGFNPDFTGRENIYLNAALLGFSSEQINDKLERISSFADLGEHLDQPVKTYSSGMIVRLAFATQIQVEPEILIIDEALAVGDALFQKRCFRKIEELLSIGTTLLFVSHDQETVRTLTSRALLLHKGRAIDWGVSSNVVLSYRKLLHEDERNYFSSDIQSVNHDLNREIEIDLTKSPEVPTKAIVGNDADVITPAEKITREVPFDRLSFGDCQVKIVQVETTNVLAQHCSVFYPGEPLLIKITCQAFTSISKLNVSVRLRNKEGVKIYSWGTLNQDMTTRSRNDPSPVFWERRFEKGEVFNVIMKCNCDLGENLYEVQAVVTYEQSMNYMSQRVLHWVDEAAFFQVLVKRDEYFFGGVADLKMSALW